MFKKIKQSKNATGVERNIYMAYFVGQNLLYQFITLALMFYWTAIIGISGVIAGLIMMIAKFWDAFNDPILAGIVNKVGRNRFGQYKPWLFATAFLLPITLIMVFSAPFGGDTSQIIWAAVSYVVFWMVYTITDVPIYSLSMTMEPNLKRRTKLLLLGRIGASFAGILVSVIYRVALVSNDSKEMFTIMSIVLAAISMLVMIPIFMVKERSILKDQAKIGFKQMFKTVFGNKHLLKMVIAMIMSRLFLLVPATFGGYLIAGGWIASNTTSVIIMTLVSGIFGFVITILLSKMLMKLGARKSLFILEFLALIIFISGALSTYWTHNIWTYMIMGMGSSIVFMVPSVINKGKFAAETIEYGQYKNGVRDEATIFATQTLVTKLMAGLSSFIAGAILTTIGFVEGEKAQTNTVFDSIFWISFGVTLLIIAINVFFYGFFYNLRSKDVEIMAAANRENITKEQAEAELAKPFKERSIDNLTDPIIPPSQT